MSQPERSQEPSAKDFDFMNKSYSELADEVDNPDLPDWIHLSKNVTKFRRHPIAAAIDRTRGTVFNEKVIRCQQFKKERGHNVPLPFIENTNKEKLILEHVKKYGDQFAIAYKDNR